MVEKKEYELIYDGKEREVDILANTLSIPFQPVRKFPKNGEKIDENQWHNKLIFGDNLQALRYLKKLQDEEKLEKIKLIYIDPPFGTGDLYDAKGAPAYSAALQGAEFLEFLRKRLVLLREILADDGSIFVRIDYHFGHYIKVLMDEIFDKNNFRNEIVINRSKYTKTAPRRFLTKTDSLFFYTKSENYYYKNIRKELPKEEQVWRPFLHLPGENKTNKFRIVEGKKFYPPKGRHWAFSQENLDIAYKKGLARINPKTGEPEIKTIDKEVSNNWTDIPGYTARPGGYPTENSEELLERIIISSSKPGDLVLDCFAGSGTTGAVAEKLYEKGQNRRWIMVDCSKLAIYTMQKRLLNLKERIGNSGKSLATKPFALYNAGLYDFDLMKKLGETDYKNFVLDLFQSERKVTEINGFKMDGVLNNSFVHIFLDKYLTEDYIKDLHEIIKDAVEGKDSRVFIIAPATSVKFCEDYVTVDKTRYFVLRIPYSIIEELLNEGIQKKKFKYIMQPFSSDPNIVNQIVDAVGFDLILPPEVKYEIYKQKIKPDKAKLSAYTGKDAGNEIVIEIKDVKINPQSRYFLEFEDKNPLGMILIDSDYNGEYFNLTETFFAEDIKEIDNKIRISMKNTGKKMMIIFIDILGNELKVVKDIEEI